MTDQHPPQTFFDRIHQSVRMRPRWYYWTRTFGLALGIALLALVVVFTFGVFIFLWRERSLGTFPGFGLRGIPILVRGFPWHAAALCFAGLVGILVLIRRFTHGYRWPLLFVIALAVMGATVFGALSSRVPLHGILANRSVDGNLPPWVGSVYRPYVQDDHIVLGQIIKLTNDGCLLATPDGTITVRFLDETQIYEKRDLGIGMNVVILGERSNQKIDADAIRLVPHVHHFHSSPPLP